VKVEALANLHPELAIRGEPRRRHNRKRPGAWHRASAEGPSSWYGAGPYALPAWPLVSGQPPLPVCPAPEDHQGHGNHQHQALQADDGRPSLGAEPAQPEERNVLNDHSCE